jgi:hypothetical protein
MSFTELTAKFFSETLILGCTAIVASCTILLRKKIKVYAGSIIKQLAPKRYQTHIISREEVERDIIIQRILTELRVHTNCDRAYVLQFQNGSTFSSRNPVWRLSCTHESPGQGIKQCVDIMQHIISSSISEILYPLWTDDLSACPGVSKISPANCHCANIKNCQLPKGVRFYDVDKMTESYSKGLLQSKATKYMIASPILDQFNNQIAILFLDYCWQDSDANKIMAYSEILCKTASTLSIEFIKKLHISV